MPYNTRYFLLCVALFAGSVSPAIRPSHPPQSADILIVAPHPDDATLCCAGFIQQAISKGQSVHILELTNGEAYASAAAYLSKKPVTLVTTTDHLRLGNARKKEEYRAMGILGLPSRNITFLGYPDGLLEEVYNTRGNAPLPSRYTGLSASPETGSSYTNTTATNDIAAAILRTKPAYIIVPDIQDTALDHRITRQFVDDAIKKTAYRGQLLTYIVHSDTTLPFPSSASLLRIHLTAYEQHLKQNAITAYRTQHAIDREYLFSFIQDEEVFVQLTHP